MQQRVLKIGMSVLAALVPVYGQTPADAALAAAKLAKAADQMSGRQVIVGRPFSATEERHSLQVLADGTRMESRQTNRFYRDSDGRTRVEEQGGNVTLLDPVAGFSATLDASGARVLKKATVSPLLAEQQLADLKKADRLMSNTGALRTEVLAPQMIGGVLANGTRTTTTIPMGAVGNDRPINIVTERWYSEDLQILVKSTNSDPRFGDTTYEVTGIVQGAPDPALFQLPANISVPLRAADRLQQAADDMKRKADALKKLKDATNEHE
jgi:hypothetical protein